MKIKFFMLPVAIAVFMVMSGFSTGVDKDPSQNILEESKAKLRNLKDFSADFLYTIQNPNLKPVTQSGNILYKKGKYVIKLEDQELYCNKVTLWIHILAENPVHAELQKMNYDEDEGMNVESIFNIYESSTKSQYEGSETVHGVETEKIFLVMQDPELDYNRAYVWINKRTKILEKVLLIDRRQTQTIYEFSNIKTDTGVSDSAFNFNEKGFKGEIYDETTN
ncbi:MAG: outer membrane lipoprotein carrier protein LolA [Bacteroidetes bacterium]|nr:outer membrane lipoprotein carrier protein LolA [Bacteroidota bacterium]MCB0843839.1 outer membrane lipoprotein carrier protein LolA [Bacteroidota bacterium]MCB0856385.1 outer membrane lipoprotein carrier protein LolA [Bacteroidota bacterium]